MRVEMQMDSLICFYSVNLALSQAIENDQQDIFQTAVAAMKMSAMPSEHVLDVCEMVPDPLPNPLPDPHEYAMTLLAFAGYYARLEMLQLLIMEGARKSTIIQPPLQHCHWQHTYYIFVLSKKVAIPNLTETDLHALLSITEVIKLKCKYTHCQLPSVQAIS